MFERFARHTQASPLFARYGRVRGVPLLDHAAALTHAHPRHTASVVHKTLTWLSLEVRCKTALLVPARRSSYGTWLDSWLASRGAVCW